MLFYVCGIAYIVLLVLVMIFLLPDADQKAAGKKEGLIDSLKHTHFSVESVSNDPDRIPYVRYFPVMVKLCTELCKRECWLGESIYHADLLLCRNNACTSLHCSTFDKENQETSDLFWFTRSSVLLH